MQRLVIAKAVGPGEDHRHIREAASDPVGQPSGEIP